MLRSSWVEQYANFSVEAKGDFDPDEFTRLVGIAPTKSWRQGDSRTVAGEYQFSAWFLQGPKLVEVDSEPVVLALLDRLDGNETALADARIRMGLRYGVGLVIEMHGHYSDALAGGPGLDVMMPALSLSPNTLTRLAALGCSLGVDQYVYV